MPLEQLIADLLKQFNKPTLLGARGVVLSKAEIDEIALTCTNQQSLPDSVASIITALADIVQESSTELQNRFGLTFAESLAQTDMSAVGNWETTAEFLEIANHKSNAELRISAGVSLMAFLGDVRYAEHLFTVMQQDKGLDDVDAVIARRALATYSGIRLEADDWETQVRAMIFGNSNNQ
jgi:hypothetical protein